jgi:SAM-dependent methyltransferase
MGVRRDVRERHDDGEVAALRALTAGDTEPARAALATGVRRPLLNAALATYLAATGDGRVYDRPAAFTAFIRGGGNVALYDAVSGALAARYWRHGVTSLVDLGCGDGRALAPALAAAGTAPAVTLVEPSRALLDAALAALAGAGGGTVTAHATDAATFTRGLAGRSAGFDLAESTFALHALPHEERSAVLTALRGHVSHLVLAEFDVPGHPAGGDAHLAFLADTYEQGLAEYDADRDLVAQGFLMPVLTGQLAPGARRSTWEQPAAAWAEQVAACGYRDVVVEPLCDYWSSPAFLLTADA